MRISKGFIKSSLIYTLAGMLPMASAIILLPFYITNLSTADYGALSIYLAFSLFIQILTTYSFDTSLYIHFHEFKGEPAKLSSFISSAFVLMLMIGGGVGIVSLVLGDLTFSHFFTDKNISFFPYGILAAGTGIFQALFKVHSNLLQSREKPEIFFWSNLLSFMLIAGFTIIGLQLYPHSLIGPIGGRMIAALIAAIWVLIRIFSEFGVHFNYPLLRSSFQFNLYAFIYQLQQWVINYFDRFIMLFFMPLSDVGIYDFGIKCMSVIEFILNGLHSSFYPKVVSAVTSQKEKGSSVEINRYYHGFTSVIMILICMSILVFPWVIETFVSKPDYRRAVEYLPYIALIFIIKPMRLFFAIPYGILKYTKPLPVIYFIISAVKILCMVLLLSEFKIYGVIFASILSAGVEVLLLRYQAREKFQFRFNLFKIILAPFVLFVLIAVLEPLMGTYQPAITHLIYLVSCLGLLYWVYRQEVKLIDPRNFIK
ncbi:lipopolysaccharide biosynthesis protein [Ohtaekwangia koreensis]|uniref:Membrane protein involved in the export of O-antigen and teichoic acid n=1 Tax=Ohtaekwangia koreensis TaxID=688867 RepID=A0A1T5K011_9BACT|nr:oligosaccharide flippase family protein [Ohtaekwangia koreensis]SKC57021.1 Membrane protein involved in the export of O-antigen and teichoic acid [Ohtaekwangia koreensis]